MQVSGHLHALTFYPRGKKKLGTTEQEVGWKTGSVNTSENKSTWPPSGIEHQVVKPLA